MVTGRDVNRRWILRRRPNGELRSEHLDLTTEPIGEINSGQVLVRTVYTSLDPAHRLYAREKDSYIPSVPLGGVMRSFNMGVVEESQNADFATGDIVTGVFGWEDYSVSAGDGSDYMSVVDMDPRLPLAARFALFEHIGLAAYFGLVKIIDPRPGDTLVVSAAAGAVGSMAVQIGKILGCRVIGIAGSDAKCALVRDEFGADVAINYRTADLTSALRAAAPDGVNGFIDGVGGEILEAVLEVLAMNARIAMAGFISQYENDAQPYGPGNIYNLINQRARIEGYSAPDFASDSHAWAKAHRDITDWYFQGRIKYRLDVDQGLENAPQSLRKLFSGKNEGKLLIQVSEEPIRQPPRGESLPPGLSGDRSR
jgi:NADPH-dependent curcumin reductase